VPLTIQGVVRQLGKHSSCDSSQDIQGEPWLELGARSS
jgi:hypothetical protein